MLLCSEKKPAKAWRNATLPATGAARGKSIDNIEGKLSNCHRSAHLRLSGILQTDYRLGRLLINSCTKLFISKLFSSFEQMNNAMSNNIMNTVQQLFKATGIPFNILAKPNPPYRAVYFRTISRRCKVGICNAFHTNWNCFRTAAPLAWCPAKWPCNLS